MNHSFLPPRRLTGLLIALFLFVGGTVLGYPPNPRANYWYHVWVASDVNKPHEVIGTSPKTCNEFSRGSVCAEFKNYQTGSVAGMCCLDPADLGTDDPAKCLAGATYSRDTEPVE